MTVMEFLEQKLKPKYIGWKDQYLAILYVLGIDPESSMKELRETLERKSSD